MSDTFFNRIDSLDLGTPEKGKFLISEPFLPDPNFSRTVIFLTEHNNEGSVGFVLNRELDIPIEEAIDNFPRFDGPLYVGGPVDNTSLFYLHTLGDKIKGCHHIIDNLYWGGEFNDLKSLLISGKAGSKEVRFFTGYSGWDETQLDKEMRQRSWIVADATVEQVMSTEIDKLWQKVLSDLGTNFAMMAKFPVDPTLN
ncbi:MAG: YqgE/AlgH family protein [Flavobacteriales bacterium]|nr:YqgE/AlgH family protein [Flavobacteriales bacterium]